MVQKSRRDSEKEKVIIKKIFDFPVYKYFRNLISQNLIPHSQAKNKREIKEISYEVIKIA